ncbi:hypothetical protein Pcinc_020898 [Petrolisthes cinctipes]|uniref:Ionotropic glutamate receptor C-terminal domain-containing protein n=1 Tax=Petrolisthes cinctipes TaxID=88211 RepID=A0AAE1FHF8_PETCI|nr:hypothetical protein Pcinc_020898 [Petrolisthes cinctipes]
MQTYMFVSQRVEQVEALVATRNGKKTEHILGVVKRSCFMVKMEEPLPRWHALAYPYHPWSWLAILVGFILSGPVLFLLATASSQCSGDEKTSLAKLGYSWGYSSGCHFQEPQTAEPRMDSTRIFVLFLWLYTMILSIVYSTNLTAFLLVTKAPTSIQTMEELYQSGREVASIGMTGVRWLKGQEYGGGDLTDSWEAGQVAAETGTVLAFNMDHMQGAFMVAAIGWYVFVSQRVEQVEALVATRNGKKTEHILGVVKECYMPFSIALGLQQHSPLKWKFDQVIGWIRQSGFIPHAVKQALRLAAKGGQEGEWRVYMNMLYWGEGVRPVTTWRHHRFTSQSQLFPDKLDDLQGAVLKEYGGGGGGEMGQEVTEEGAVVALNVDHMQGVFMITAIGWFIAVVLFLLEIFILRSYMFPSN